ncbi:anaphase-promoting complex subunit 5-like [Branchiostoma floridae]|uniref:Anaphase-promoting complex subunit 5 n=1 Tax=Branchiostoma floridae TaxID=7739 RepID=A0A9J7MKY6_BRAFL|nr:anaphase-promoting complex subunit 5-like [Branchiostoma floridae]
MDALQGDLFHPTPGAVTADHSGGIMPDPPWREWVTPHKISLLILISEYVQSKAERSQGITDVFTKTLLFGVRLQRNFSLALLKWIQSPDETLADLRREVEKLAEGDPSTAETVVGWLDNKLKEMAQDGLMVLTDFMQSLEQLFNLSAEGEEPLLQRAGVVGMFIRRMVLAFDKLSFSQVSSLYELLMEYCQEGKSSVRDNLDTSDAMEMADEGEGMRREDLEVGKEDSTILSYRQAQYYLSLGLQNNYNDAEASSPAELQQQVQRLLKSNPLFVEAHYLSYLNSMNVYEWCGAVQSLHLYFDRFSLHSQHNQQSKPNEDAMAARSYRYAALNLASLHCRFGHREEAMAVLQEAIRLAQVTNDNVCLQHALIWLSRLEQDESKVAMLLQRSVIRASVLTLPYLASMAVQMFTKLKAQAGLKPARVFEYLAKSNSLNCLHYIPELVASCFALQTALWQMYGKSAMSLLNIQLLLHGSGNPTTNHWDKELGCLVLSHLAVIHADQGNYTCVYEILQLLKEKFHHIKKNARVWMFAEQCINFDRALRNHKWTAAETAITSLAALDNTEAQYRRALLLKEKGDSVGACKHLQELLQKCREEPSTTITEIHAGVLLALGEVYTAASNLTTANSYFLQCLTLCKEHHLNHMATMAQLNIAHIQLLMKLPTQALALTEQVMPQVLSHGSLYNRSRAQFLLAKCQLASSDPKHPTQRKAAILSAIGTLGIALEGFQKVEAPARVKDVLYYQAQLYNEVGNSADRNRCALQFRQLDQQVPTNPTQILNIF